MNIDIDTSDDETGEKKLQSLSINSGFKTIIKLYKTNKRKNQKKRNK